MTVREALQEKVDAAYAQWQHCSNHIGIRSTFFWWYYKHWKNELDKLPLEEAGKEMSKEKEDGNSN